MQQPDGHAEGERVDGGRDTPSLCPTLQVLDMSTLGDAVELTSTEILTTNYRVIHKSLRDFRPLRYSKRDVHAEEEHVNRRRDTPNSCPTLQVLDMSTPGDAADVNPVIKFLPHACNVCGRNDLPCIYVRAQPSGVKNSITDRYFTRVRKSV